MASKIYTAQEMRHAADTREAWGDKDEVNNMLRQAADMIEREERRKKKYEYSAKYGNGFVSELHSSTIGGTDYAKESKGFVGVVRREVGEWEEVAK